MIGDPPTWLIYAGAGVAVIAMTYLADALGREVREMILDERRYRAAQLADETSGDRPAALQGDLPRVPDEAKCFHGRGR